MKRTAILFSILTWVTASCDTSNDYKPSKQLTAKVFQKITPAELLSIPADGVSTAKITVELSPDAEPSQSKITFKTSKGLFRNKQDTTNIRASRTYDENNDMHVTAVAELTSITTLDTAVIDIGIGDFKAQAKVRFAAAEPESITIKVSALHITTGYDKSLTITTGLVRKIGTCTDHLKCDIAVLDNSGTPIGVFLNYNNDTKGGTVDNIWTLGTLTYSGDLTIVATYVSITGTTRSSTSKVSAN